MDESGKIRQGVTDAVGPTVTKLVLLTAQRFETKRTLFNEKFSFEREAHLRENVTQKPLSDQNF